MGDLFVQRVGTHVLLELRVRGRRQRGSIWQGKSASASRVPLSVVPGSLERLLTQGGCSLRRYIVNFPLHYAGMVVSGETTAAGRTYSLRALGAPGDAINGALESSSSPGWAGWARWVSCRRWE